MLCRNCGREIEDNSIFCNWCGTKQIRESRKTVNVPEPRRLKSGSWNIQLRINGVSTSITEETAEACRIKARAMKSGMIETRKHHRITLTEAIDKYIDARSNTLSPSTLSKYRSIQRNRFQKYMKKPIDDIDCRRMLNDEAAGKLAAKTLKNAWGLAQSAMKEAGRHVELEAPTGRRKERAWLTWEQIPVFMEAAEGKRCELAALLALHSLRRSELFALRWEDIDLQKNILHISGAVVQPDGGGLIRREKNKTAAGQRTVPILIPRLEELLQSVPEELRSGQIITDHINTPAEQINRVCEDAGLPLVGLHGLRHSFASLGYHLRISELEVMRLGGWSDYNVVHKIYTHLAESDLQAGVEKLKDYYDPQRQKNDRKK